MNINTPPIQYHVVQQTTACNNIKKEEGMEISFDQQFSKLIFLVSRRHFPPHSSPSKGVCCNVLPKMYA
jgi:hypothetical protein